VKETKVKVSQWDIPQNKFNPVGPKHPTAKPTFGCGVWWEGSCSGCVRTKGGLERNAVRNVMVWKTLAKPRGSEDRPRPK